MAVSFLRFKILKVIQLLIYICLINIHFLGNSFFFFPSPRTYMILSAFSLRSPLMAGVDF